MELKEAEILCRSLMARHGLFKHGYDFKWNSRYNGFGFHNGRKRIISLSRRLVALNNEEEVKDTILHEIAHALDFIRNGFQYRYSNYKRMIHDDTWKAICEEIGCKPRRCYTSKEVVSPKRPNKYKLIHLPTEKVVKYSKRKPKYFGSPWIEALVDGVRGRCEWRKME